MKTRILAAGMGIIFALALAGCETVQPYQKMYLNDRDMALKVKKSEQYELNFESYREGASGANGGKTGGGCGCN